MCVSLPDVFECLVWLGQAYTQLEVATWLARKIGHQIGYYLWYLELK